MTSERILITGGSGFIGSHLIDGIVERGGTSLLNCDIKPPNVPAHVQYWFRCDIKDREALAYAFRLFQPTVVIHLAAKANLQGSTIADFPDNTVGTRNVVEEVNKTKSVRSFVNTSTQYVVRPGAYPSDPAHLEPYTAYGESKAEAERVVRDMCHRPWAIVRPTNIWGPRHPFFPYELWPYLERRYYIHPGFRPVRKYYGYVRNAVRQILFVALQTDTNGSGRIWYITDGYIDNAQWMDAFSVSLSGKPMRRAPLAIWRCLALTGDIAKALGLSFPVDSNRLFRLTTNEYIPDEMIVRVPGEKMVSLYEGVAESVAWFRGLQRNASNRLQ